MKQLNQTQRTILELLADGNCHTGTQLGNTLNITRSAIWKQINQLIELGVPIISWPQQKYQLKHPFILLNEEVIETCLQKKNWNIAHELHLFSSIDSTNRYLKELPHTNTIPICCAEFQTQGRGRFGRNWYSPFGENIYCSSRWQVPYDLGKLSGLSLVTSLAVLAALNQFNQNQQIKIKWPNDILWQGKKLCGSLIEIIAESHAHAQVIIGIGLNVNSDTQNNTLLDKPWCSLYEITQKTHDRNELIALLITQLDNYLQRFFKEDFNVFLHEWASHDYLYGKEITVTQTNKTLTGSACGINEIGQLILKDKQGYAHLLSSGDTTLQQKNQNST